MSVSNLSLRSAAAMLLCFCVMGCTNDAEENNGGVGKVPSGGVTTDGGKKGDPGTDDPITEDDDSGDKLVYLDQGWNDDARRQFYYLGQGSQLVPYSWFVNLELPDSNELFRSDRHLASFGFITQPPGDRNEDGLPIGFIKDVKPPSFAVNAAQYTLDNLPNQSDWLGFTCAACHTADLTYKGKVIRIDGGAAMTDMESFLAALAKSMQVTAADDVKFAAFAKRVKDAADGLDGAVPPRDEFKAYTLLIEKLVERNKAPHPYGFARLDAFGAILNQITEVAVDIPANRRPSSAPVSYPFLWDAPHMDWVQWNSVADIPIARNVGEVLGVYGHVELTDNPDAGYASSARLDYLHRLEVSLRVLQAPAWPAELFGEISESKAAAGKKLFAENCGNCHNSRDDEGNFAMTPPNQVGKTYIKTTSVPFNKIGTDPQMVVNFATRTSQPGILADAVSGSMDALRASGGLDRITQLRAAVGMPAPDFSQEVPAVLLLKEAVSGVSKKYLREALQNRTDAEKTEIILDLRNGHPPDENNSPPNGGAGYRARPLNGVWATAPFLHNGSVPNLWELLKPESERVKSFYVGSREFDPKHVGLNTEGVAGAFHFQTVSESGAPIPGNSNLGHSGHWHTQREVPDNDPDTDDWHDFTDDERWALIEYIKTLQ